MPFVDSTELAASSATSAPTMSNMKIHKEEHMEAAWDDVETQLDQRRVELPTTDVIKEYVEDFRDFLWYGTFPERKALIRITPLI